MKKSILLLVLVLLIGLFLTGCGSKPSSDLDMLPNTTQVVEKETHFDISEIQGIEESTISISKDGKFSGTIIKKNADKTAEVNFNYYFSDADEKITFMGTTSFIAPSNINIICKYFPDMFIDSNYSDLNSKLNSVTDLASNIETEETNNLIDSLTGYIVNKVQVSFIDSETDELIAKCSAVDKTDVQFEINREYDPAESFQNVQIGVYD